MCGLYGILGGVVGPIDKSIVHNLSAVSILRGKDSSGFAISGLNAEGKRVYRTRKGMEVAPEFLLRSGSTSSPFYSFLGSKDDVYSFIGHCRAATLGAVIQENAHPFQVDNIIGVHNGTCSHMVPSNLSKKDKGTKLGSDSYNIMVYLSNHTPKESYEHFDKFGGAFALVWYDTEKNTINFLRNEKRSLYYVRWAGLYFWASEKIFLMAAFNRHGTTRIFESEIKEFKVGVHYSAPCFEKGGSAPLFTEEVVAEPKKTFQSSGFIPWSGMYGDQADNGDEDDKEKKTTIVEIYSNKSKIPDGTTSVPTIISDPTHHQFNQRLITIKQINTLQAASGQDKCTCCGCDGSVDFTKPLTWYSWFSDDDKGMTNEGVMNNFVHICPKCEENKMVEQLQLKSESKTVSTPYKFSLAG